MSIPNCTLTTACMDLTPYSNKSRDIETAIKNMDTLLRIPCYLVIFCDIRTAPLIKRIRNDNYGLSELTHYITTSIEDLWTYYYIDNIIENRRKYFPTETHRSSVEKHLVCCNKFDFVLQTIELNPFNTTKFGWIDSSIGVDAKIICEDYSDNMLLHLLHNITDNFHIQILNVTNKKFKQKDNLREYYQQYRYIVCGGLFTTGSELGYIILNRLKEIFVDTTRLGYGHNEEMLYLGILDEFYDFIIRSYGDYQNILNNFIKQTRGFQYVYDFIFIRYYNYGYYKEGIDCGKRLLKEIENCNIPINYELYFSILVHYNLCIQKDDSTTYTEKSDIRKHIFKLIDTNPYIQCIFEKGKEYYLERLDC